MLHPKFTLIVGIGGAVMLVCSPARIAFSSDTSAGNLSPGQIFLIVQENYDSLSSYSDQGQIVTSMDDTPVNTAGFDIRLSRPGFYQIEWSPNGSPSDTVGNSGSCAVWSSGAGDFVEMGWGVQRQYDRDIALAKAEATSGSAAVAVPDMFFNTPWQDQRDHSILDEKRMTDEKVGKEDCYVVARELQNGETKTYWIGKRSLLIYQIRTEIPGKAVQQALEGTAHSRPTVIVNFHDLSSIETHTNIVLNRAYSRADFVPSFPLFQQ